MVPNVLTILASLAEQLEAAAAKNVSGPGGLTIDEAFNDVATLEEIIPARAGGSLAVLLELLARYQGAPGPTKGRAASPWYRLHLLTLDLAEDWGRLTLNERYRDEGGRRLVPATNNVSERGIGLNIKERYRTMRGYTGMVSLRGVPVLTAYLRENQGTECFTGLLAG